MKPIRWIVSAALVVAALTAGAVAFGTAEPRAPMQSIVNVARAMDRTGMPPLSRFTARDGTALAYRAYPAEDSRQIAVLFHGSSDSSHGMHAVAATLQQAGISAVAVDVRGHGESGPRGDIAYVGQLEDDTADLLAHLKSAHPGARFTAMGHSSGGGFVIRLAGSAAGPMFDGFVVTAPYLHYRAPTSRGMEGNGWARPFVPRLIGLQVLHLVGIERFDGLPVIAFALPPEAPGTKTYSFRLYRNYGPHPDYVDDVRRGGRPLTVIAGTADEVFRADRYEEALAPVSAQVRVQLIDSVGHMAAVQDPRALAAIRSAVAATAH